MKTRSPFTYFLIGILSLYMLSSLSSCTAQRSGSAWQDVGHARELDHKKGNRSKRVQNHTAKVHHY